MADLKAVLRDIFVRGSNIPKRYLQTIDLKVYEEDKLAYARLFDIKKNIADFVSKGDNLLLHSSFVGNGKTTMACILGQALIEHQLEVGKLPKGNVPLVYFMNLQDFLAEKKAAIDSGAEARQEVLVKEKAAREARLLILDDIGVRDASEFDKAFIYTLINHRTNNLLSTIYTSNLTEAELESCLGARIKDRVCGFSKQVEFKGGSRR